MEFRSKTMPKIDVTQFFTPKCTFSIMRLRLKLADINKNLLYLTLIISIVGAHRREILRAVTRSIDAR